MLPPPPRRRYHFERSTGIVLAHEYRHFMTWLFARITGLLLITEVEADARGADSTTRTAVPPSPKPPALPRGIFVKRAQHQELAAWIEKNAPPKQPAIDQAAEADDA